MCGNARASFRDRFVSEFDALCPVSHYAPKMLMSNAFRTTWNPMYANYVGLLEVYLLRHSYEFQK